MGFQMFLWNLAPFSLYSSRYISFKLLIRRKKKERNAWGELGHVFISHPSQSLYVIREISSKNLRDKCQEKFVTNAQACRHIFRQPFKEGVGDIWLAVCKCRSLKIDTSTRTSRSSAGSKAFAFRTQSSDFWVHAHVCTQSTTLSLKLFIYPNRFTKIVVFRFFAY